MSLNSIAILGLLFIITLRLQRIQSAPLAIDEEIQSLSNLEMDPVRAAPPIFETGLKVGNDTLDEDQFAVVVNDLSSTFKGKQSSPISHVPRNIFPRKDIFLYKYKPSNLQQALTSSPDFSDTLEALTDAVKSVPVVNTYKSFNTLNESIQEFLSGIETLTKTETENSAPAEQVMDPIASKSQSVVKKDLSLVPSIQTGVFPHHALKPVSVDESNSKLQIPEVLSNDAGIEELLKVEIFANESKDGEEKVHPTAITKLEPLHDEDHLHEELQSIINKLEESLVSQIKEKPQENSPSTSKPAPVNLLSDSEQSAVKPGTGTGNGLVVQEVFPIGAEAKTPSPIQPSSVDSLTRSPVEQPRETPDLNAVIPPAIQNGINLSNEHGNPFYFLMGPFMVSKNSLFSYLGPNNLAPVSNILHFNNTDGNENPEENIMRKWTLAKKQAHSMMF